jgi:hypothetical protein
MTGTRLGQVPGVDYWQGRGFQWAYCRSYVTLRARSLLAACNVVLELEVRLDIGGELGH